MNFLFLFFLFYYITFGFFFSFIIFKVLFRKSLNVFLNHSANQLNNVGIITPCIALDLPFHIDFSHICWLIIRPDAHYLVREKTLHTNQLFRQLNHFPDYLCSFLLDFSDRILTPQTRVHTFSSCWVTNCRILCKIWENVLDTVRGFYFPGTEWLYKSWLYNVPWGLFPFLFQ